MGSGGALVGSGDSDSKSDSMGGWHEEWCGGETEGRGEGKMHVS